MNRSLPKVSGEGYASAETLVRQFGLPIESAAELVNESHVKLQDWAMETHQKASDLAHLNLALQNHVKGQQEALVQQDKLLNVYANQVLNHQEYMKELIPHLARYRNMEELLLDSSKLADYYRNLRAVEQEHGTHAEVAARNEQVAAQQLGLTPQGLANLKALRASGAFNPQVPGAQPQQNVAPTPNPNQAPSQVPDLPFPPGAILDRLDPNTLSKDEIAYITSLDANGLKNLEYQMAVKMGVIDPAGNLLRGEGASSNVVAASSNTPVPTPGQQSVGGTQARSNVGGAGNVGGVSGVPANSSAMGSRAVASEHPAQRETYIQQIINGRLPASTAQLLQAHANRDLQEAAINYGNPLTVNPDNIPFGIRPGSELPEAGRTGSPELAYPTLDQLPANSRFLLLDKLEKEGAIGQRRLRSLVS